MSDEKLIEFMVSEPSWEDVIVKIVIEEKMDPWDIDLVELTNHFMRYIERMKQLDLRIPGRFILIAAILLRMKSDYFAEKKEKEKKTEVNIEMKENKEEELKILAQIPPLNPPVERIPMRNVTLDELITALKKAFEVKERREIRRQRRRVKVERLIEEEEEDITKRVDILLKQIRNILDEIEKEEIEFSKLVNNWKREEIIRTLLPILHLAQEGKVTYEQPKLFDEIYVKLKKVEENE